MKTKKGILQQLDGMFCSKNEIICSNSCLMTIITHILMLQFRYKMTFLGLYMPDKCLYDGNRSVTLS